VVAGEYKVKIKGTFPRILMNGNATHAPRLISVDQW
jgi:hypothetical protein